jgi:hypothetical protein
MKELALGHGQVVRLVMRPAGHEADEAKTADVLHRCRKGAGP